VQAHQDAPPDALPGHLPPGSLRITRNESIALVRHNERFNTHRSTRRRC
jgi:hypothetical protein